MLQLPFDSYRMLTRCIDRWSSVNILDLGASVGHTVTRALDEFPCANIWALEPEPASFRALKERTAHAPSVRAFNLAASDRAGTQQFHVAECAPCSSLLPFSSLGAEYYPAWHRQQPACNVQTVRLDHWAPTANLHRIDILKIDVQGMELPVLRTLESALTRDILAVDCEAQFVQEYQGASTFLDIACMLRDHGFILHQVHNMWYGGKEMQTTCMDGLWLKQPLIDRLRATPAPLLDPSPAGVLRRALTRMRELGWSSISLYGAGSFTRRALQDLTDPPLHIASIADDNPALHGTTLSGIPLVSLEDAATNVNAVVLSSDGHEAALLRNTAALRSRGVIVVPISSYHPEFAHHHPLSPRATACAA